jgi:hypothetical protein
MSNKFFQALLEDDAETVEECLAAGGPGEGVNDVDKEDGFTPLHKACKVRGSHTVKAHAVAMSKTLSTPSFTLERHRYSPVPPSPWMLLAVVAHAGEGVVRWIPTLLRRRYSVHGTVM